MSLFELYSKLDWTMLLAAYSYIGEVWTDNLLRILPAEEILCFYIYMHNSELNVSEKLVDWDQTQTTYGNSVKITRFEFSIW